MHSGNRYRFGHKSEGAIMADRFSGTIQFGGRISKATHNLLLEMCEEISEFAEYDEGEGLHFTGFNSSDMEPLAEFCKANGIDLSIAWEAKWEFGSFVEYYINGEHKVYNCNVDGEIVITVDKLLEHPHMFIGDFVDSLKIPEMPELEIVDDLDSESPHHDFQNHRAATSFRDAYRSDWDVVTVPLSEDSAIYRVQPKQP